MEFEEVGFFDGNFTYFFNDYVSFELSSGRSQTEVFLSDSAGTLKFGEIKQIPVLLTGRLHTQVREKIYPYVGLGAGYFVNEIILSGNHDPAFSSIYGKGAAGEVENSLGYAVNFGTEFFVKENLALNMDFKYIWTSTAVKVSAPGTGSGEYDFDLNSPVFGFGIKYFF